MEVLIFCVFCSFPWLAIALVLFQTLRAGAGSALKNVTFPPFVHSIWNWLNLLTFRGFTTLTLSFVFFLIAYEAPETTITISLISTMAVFMFVISISVLICSFLIKLILGLRGMVKFEEVSKVTISRNEIVENQPTTISLEHNSHIPGGNILNTGYFLKINVKLPEKLGYDLRGLAVKNAGNKVSFEATLPYTKRGKYKIGPVNYSYQDLFGFTNINLTDSKSIDLTIIPEVPQIKKFNFQLNQRRGDREQTITTLINTDDYYSTRPYVSGDDLRKMHWKLSAKTDEFVIRIPETTTISYESITILILNLYPRMDSIQHKTSLPLFLKFRRVVEYALDTQIRIAAAILDFALRYKIPVKLYFFDQKGLQLFEPQHDRPFEWKHKLANIQLISKATYLNLLDEILTTNSSVIVTGTETNLERLEYLKQKAGEHANQNLEIMLSPIRYHLENLMRNNEAPESKASKLLRILERILLTKPYFQQTTISEKFEQLFKRSQVKYNDQDLDKIIQMETKVNNYLQSSGLSHRIFNRRDPYASEIDNIVNILEEN